MVIETNGIPPLSHSGERSNKPLQHNDGDHRTKHHTSCSPLGLVKSSLKSISHWWPSSSNPEPKTSTAPTTEKKKYVHVPTHAAVSHLRTTSSPSIRRANEVL
ncbi:hypothetical protein QBC44DRAFT_157425 [Cladorrhinum sp. PSN332]|nr:hypothetical protein QBC44DRAFT_157425 [Cladorrhinum sp. PSN332]